MEKDYYRIIRGTPDEVTAIINALLPDGWNPLGAPTILEANQANEMVIQAVWRD